MLNIYDMLIAHYISKECNFMAIGERIRFFKNLRGMTQKYLGMRRLS